MQYPQQMQYPPMMQQPMQYQQPMQQPMMMPQMMPMMQQPEKSKTGLWIGIGVVVVLIVIFHQQIMDFLSPKVVIQTGDAVPAPVLDQKGNVAGVIPVAPAKEVPASQVPTQTTSNPTASNPSSATPVPTTSVTTSDPPITTKPFIPVTTTPSGVGNAIGDGTTAPPPLMSGGKPAQTTTAVFKPVGCYKDAVPRTMPIMNGIVSLNDCANRAKAAGFKVFGIQFSDGTGMSGVGGECWYGDDQNYSRLGAAGNCTKDAAGNIYGQSLSNAVYQWS